MPEQEPDTLTQELLDEFIDAQRAMISTRESVADIVAFLLCQTLTASLFLLLFQLAVNYWFSFFVCQLISLLPVLTSLEKITVKKQDDSWKVELAHPLAIGVKFVTSLAFNSVTGWQAWSRLRETERQIEGFYQEVEAYDTPPLPFPSITPAYFLIAIGVAGVLAHLKNNATN